MHIAFLWQGFDGRYGQWKDGLWAAMKLLEQDHEVHYFDFPLTSEIHDFKPDVVLYWEAPMTINGKDRDNYRAVCELPYKKCLLFAGGKLEAMWVKDFDLVFVESQVNEEECERLGIPYMRAFGTNTQIFKPEKQPKVFYGAFQATCASWKRHWLLAEALQEKAVICGRYQTTDSLGFDRSRKAASLILPELSAEGVSSILNASYTVVNCSDYWGGGQRTTLEAMACGIPVIVMEDSVKNREFVEEASAGMVVTPNSNDIKHAVEMLVNNETLRSIKGNNGKEYVLSKWTERHYAEALLKGIKSIL